MNRLNWPNSTYIQFSCKQQFDCSYVHVNNMPKDTKKDK